MKDIRILPAVLKDIAEAAAWYDEGGYAGLGDRYRHVLQFPPAHRREWRHLSHGLLGLSQSYHSAFSLFGLLPSA